MFRKLLAVQKSSSVFWYLLPMALAIIGGVISFFVLRKSNPRKARNCLIIGAVIMTISIIGGELFNADVIILPDTEYWQGISQHIEKYGFTEFFTQLMISFSVTVGIGFALYNFLIKKIKYKPVVYGVSVFITVVLYVFWQYLQAISSF